MQIKRNETIFETKADAKNGLKVPAGTVSDGDIIVSRYTDGSLLGVVRVDQQTDVQTWTIYDTDSRIKYVDPQGTVLYTLYEYLNVTADASGSSIALPIGYNCNSNITKVQSSMYAAQHNNDLVVASLMRDNIGAGVQYYGSISSIGYNWRTGTTGSMTQDYGTNYAVRSFNGGSIDVVMDFTAKTISINSYSNTLSVAPTLPYANNLEVKLFNHLNGSDKAVKTGDKLYSFKIWEGDTLAVDIVPAKDEINNVYGVYDRVREHFYSTSSFSYVCGGEEIGKIYGEPQTDPLPDVEFEINYNAKLYNSTTHTIPNHADAHTQVDMVFESGYYPTYTEGSDHITWPNQGRGPALGSSVNPNFNRTGSSPNLTIIAKALTTLSGGQALFVNRGGSYNWMFRWYQTRLTLHGAAETGNVTVSNSVPNIAWARVNSSGQVDYGNYTTSTTTEPIAFTYGSQNYDGPAFFRGYSTNSAAEIWAGDFYWIYMTRNTLTDEQIQQVIDYNENLTV